MINIYKDYKDLHKKKDLFESKLQSPQCFDRDTVEMVEELISLGSHLRHSTDKLKQKIPDAMSINGGATMQN
jgi:hypothetical protein